MSLAENGCWCCLTSFESSPVFKMGGTGAQPNLEVTDSVLSQSQMCCGWLTRLQGERNALCACVEAFGLFFAHFKFQQVLFRTAALAL